MGERRKILHSVFGRNLMPKKRVWKVKNRLLEIRLREYMMQDQREFAIFLDVDPSQYSRYERGEVFPGMPLALYISQRLGRTVNDIWYLV